MKKNKKQIAPDEDKTTEAIYVIGFIIIFPVVIFFTLLKPTEKDEPPSRWNENGRSEYGAAIRAKARKHRENNPNCPFHSKDSTNEKTKPLFHENKSR